MYRRTVLVAIGASTAGCVNTGAGGSDGRTNTDPNGTGTDQRTPDGRTTTDGGTPQDARERFGEYPCPSFAEGTDRTVCWHTVDPESADLYLSVASPVFEPAAGDASLPFTLHNDSGVPFGHNPYEWAIKRETEEGWEHVAPDMYIEPWETVPDGETYTWVLRVGEDATTSAGTDRERTLTVTQDLADGVYAFQITGLLEGEARTSVECVALFEVRR